LGLGIFSGLEKQQLIQTSRLSFTYFQADIALGPKTKFLLHNMKYKFYLRSNFKTGAEAIVLL
jgi:hypothetical protein